MPSAQQIIDQLKDRVETAERQITNYEAESSFLRGENKRLQIDNTLMLEQQGKLDVRQGLARDLTVAAIQHKGLPWHIDMPGREKAIGSVCDWILGMAVNPVAKGETIHPLTDPPHLVEAAADKAVEDLKQKRAEEASAT